MKSELPLLPDRLGPGVRLLLCGINPGRHSATQGHHYAGPGNRFWKALHRAGITSATLEPREDEELPALGVGLTNLVTRPSARADELEPREFVDGALRLARLASDLRPRVVAVLGLGALRVGFAAPQASVGRVDPLPSWPLEDVELWALPNPSGLNAHYSLDQQADWLRRAAKAADLRLHFGSRL